MEIHIKSERTRVLDCKLCRLLLFASVCPSAVLPVVLGGPKRFDILLGIVSIVLNYSAVFVIIS